MLCLQLSAASKVIVQAEGQPEEDECELLQCFKEQEVQTNLNGSDSGMMNIQDNRQELQLKALEKQELQYVEELKARQEVEMVHIYEQGSQGQRNH